MDKAFWSTIITSILGIGCIYFFMAVVFKDDNYGMLGGAVVMIIEILVMVITGFILYSNEKTKPVGRGVFLGMALTLVIGFGVCTTV